MAHHLYVGMGHKIKWPISTYKLPISIRVWRILKWKCSTLK